MRNTIIVVSAWALLLSGAASPWQPERAGPTPPGGDTAEFWCAADAGSRHARSGCGTVCANASVPLMCVTPVS